jgi:protein-disulfide isomerase
MLPKLSVLLAGTLILSVLASAGTSLWISNRVLDRASVSSAQVEARMREYILNNPQVLLEAVQRQEEAKQAAEENAAKSALVQHIDQLLKAKSPIGGNPNGDVTLVEFFDYNCPYCRKAGPIVAEAIAADKGLRIVYKEWPILGPGSEFAARAALAAHAQGKYEAFHQALMTSSSSVDETSTIEVAKALGLDVERLKRDMEDEAINSELSQNYTLAEKLRITGTPAFVIGEKIIHGYADLATLQQAIAGARKKSGQ